MYTLRIIEETRESVDQPFDQVIENFELGSSYSRVNNGTREFSRIMDSNYPESNREGIESIICGENEKTFFVMKNEDHRVYSYFVMTESGKTFERLY